jgi:all-trans-8'-apo-beta-carotenal 15,15'-oxygenase
MSWAGMFRDLPREHGFEPLRVEGTLPPALTGTLLRCGTALTSCFGHRYRHHFDGDGAVTAVRIGGGAAWGAVRVVETPGLVEERRAGRALFPAYGTLPPGPRRPMPRPKNAANIAMLSWRERTFALHEAGAPVEIDVAPDDLRTLGERDLDVPAIASGFAAHPHHVPARRATYSFGVRYGASSCVELFELGAERARHLGSVPLAGPTMIHDFAATERHLVFFAPPLRLALAAFASGASSYSDAMTWTPRLGTEVIVVPIDAPSDVIRFTVEPFYQWHLANAFERGDGDTMVVDYVRYPDFASNAWFGALVHGGTPAPIAQGQLTRAIIDLRARRMTSEPCADVTVELPRIGHTDDAVFAAAHSSHAVAHLPHDALARIEPATGRTELARFDDGDFPGEPVVADRFVLSLVYASRAHASYLAVLDAEHLDDGPVARAWFDHHIPYTFHGTWSGSRLPTS